MSSDELAAVCGVNSAKLRKDLSYVGSHGIRGVGYEVGPLLRHLESTLGLTHRQSVALVGIGNLGHALAGYGGFGGRGFPVTALFDVDPDLVGIKINGIVVDHVRDIPQICRERDVTIGMIATPGPAAQGACDLLVRAGVSCILNFAPVVLQVPEQVEVRKVDLAVELQILAFHVARRHLAGLTVTSRLDAVNGHAVVSVMSVLVVGLSHRSAPVELLERAAVGADEIPKLLDEMLHGSHVTEVMMLSTCNRIEVYAVVDAFHGGLADVSSVLGRHAGLPLPELTEHLYVHYAGSAVQHLFAVAAGLDSMVIGEAQILGQLRAAYAAADTAGTVGPTLHELSQQALRVGKRVHTRTGIDAAGASVVSEALPPPTDALGAISDGVRAVVVGAGAMGALAAAHLRRAGAPRSSCSTAPPSGRSGSSRTPGVPAPRPGPPRSRRWRTSWPRRTCWWPAPARSARSSPARRSPPRWSPATGARWPSATSGCPATSTPAWPRCPVSRSSTSSRCRPGSPRGPTARPSPRPRSWSPRRRRPTWPRSARRRSTPTVTALRRRASEVIDAELLRLDARLPELDPAVREEFVRTVRRVVDKLLHTPTVQVKRLAEGPDGSSYAHALRELFELDPQTPGGGRRAAPRRRPRGAGGAGAAPRDRRAPALPRHREDHR